MSSSFVSFVEKQLDVRRRQLSEYFEAALDSKIAAEHLEQRIQEAKEHGATEVELQVLQSRLEEHLDKNKIAVENYRRLVAQIREDEELLQELRNEN